MNMKFLSAAAFAAATLMAAPAMAVTVILDDFDDFQAVADGPTATRPVTSSVLSPPGTFIGDSRTLTVENKTNNGQPEAASTLTSTGGANGALAFSNEQGATGVATVTYTGLGDIQLGTLAQSFFFFDILSFDLDPTSANPAVPNAVSFSVFAEDGSGGTSEYFEVLTFGFDPTLFFSQFTPTGGGGADFNDIATLSFVLDSDNVPVFGPQEQLDGALNSISIGAVPLPASGLLLIGALGGVAAMRRRKKAA